jgi:hypothetical protein
MGILWPLALLPTSFQGHDPFTLLYSTLCLYAWYCYFVMAFAWIKNQRIEKWYPLSGTISALSILIAQAVIPIIGKTANPIKELGLTFITELFFVLPAVLMACWLVFFHLKLSMLTPHSSGTPNGAP